MTCLKTINKPLNQLNRCSDHTRIRSHLQLEWLGGLFIVHNDVEHRINIDRSVTFVYSLQPHYALKQL